MKKTNKVIACIISLLFVGGVLLSNNLQQTHVKTNAEALNKTYERVTALEDLTDGTYLVVSEYQFSESNIAILRSDAVKDVQNEILYDTGLTDGISSRSTLNLTLTETVDWTIKVDNSGPNTSLTMQAQDGTYLNAEPNSYYFIPSVTPISIYVEDVWSYGRMILRVGSIDAERKIGYRMGDPFRNDFSTAYNITFYKYVDVFESITYTGTPVKQVANGAFNAEGITFSANYSSGASEVIPLNEITFDISILRLGDTSIVASYGGKSVAINNLDVAFKAFTGEISNGKFFVVANNYYLSPSIMDKYESPENIIEPVAVPFTNIDDIPASEAWEFIANGDDNWFLKYNNKYLNDSSFTFAGLSSYTNDFDISANEFGTFNMKSFQGVIMQLDVTNSNFMFEHTIEDGNVGVKFVSAERNTIGGLVNYLLYEDNVDQCTTKFYEARNTYLSLTTLEQNEFLNSVDSITVEARERYVAWASVLSEEPWSNTSLLNRNTNNSDMLATIVVSTIFLVSISSLLGYFIISKRKTKE